MTKYELITLDKIRKARERIFEKFYRIKLANLVPSLLDKWQDKIGVTVREVKIKKMKTKWGSCIPTKKRIWLNLELAKKPEHCIEYVVVHELLHLIEKKHSRRFFELMESNMPKWKRTRA